MDSILRWIRAWLERHDLAKVKPQAECWPNPEEVDHARREWQFALRIFNEISEPGMIDYAVYNLQAAEKRYGYLIGLFRDSEIAAASAHRADIRRVCESE
ncbi:MAG: DUF2508 family protein [Solirubrobacterales bacterium]